MLSFPLRQDSSLMSRLPCTPYSITLNRASRNLSCVLKKLSYVFRVKAPSSLKSILSSYYRELLDDLYEFDVAIRRFFTNKYRYHEKVVEFLSLHEPE